MSKVKSNPEVQNLGTEEVALIEKEISRLPQIPVIKSDTAYDKARDDYKAFREAEKLIKAKKDSVLKPLNDSVKAVKLLFKPYEDRLEVAIDAYQNVLTAYANAKEIKRLQELEKVENDKRLSNPATIQAKKDAAGQRLDGTMKIKRLVITNPALVPDEFWIIDEAKVKRALLEGLTVPGAELKEELVVTAR